MRARLVLFALGLAACGEAEANPMTRGAPAPVVRPIRVRVAPPPPPLSQTAAAVVAAASPTLTRPTEMAVTPAVLPPSTESPAANAAAAPSSPTAAATPPSPGEPPGAPASPVPTPPETASGEPAGTAAVGADTARAHELVSAWLVAQNEGRFDDYSGLYAESFQGIKRSGARVRRFDRAGWLTDRRGMFSIPMHVHARDIEVSPTAQGTRVRFTQVFRAARYHDEGPKELLLVERAGRLVIAREEMMQSRLGNPARPATDLSPGTFMLAVHHGDATWLVVSRTVEPSWSTGDASLVERGPIAVTRKAAVPGALPPELAALGGSDVRLFGARADVCSGRITELAVMRRADVHPSTERIWERESGEPAAIAARIAAAAWDLGADGAMLVGRVESSSSACSGAHWGRLAALPFPTLFVPIPPPPPVAAHALESFRLLPSWRALQREYTTATRAAPDRPWDEHGAARPTVTLWSDGTTQWVSVTHRVALGDCDQWRGRLWALFEVEETGLALRTDVTDPGYHVPVASVDTDGDGAPDFVTEDGLVRRRGDVHQVVESLAYARHDRDCR